MFTLLSVFRGVVVVANISSVFRLLRYAQRRSFFRYPKMTVTQELQVPTVLTTENATLPRYEHPTAPGASLFAAEKATIAPGDRKLIATGVKVALPAHTYGRIAPLNSLADVAALGWGAGVIDADYRGEIKLLLHNHGTQEVVVNAGDAAALMIVQPFKQASEKVLSEAEPVKVTIATKEEAVKKPSHNSGPIEVAYEGEPVEIAPKGTFTYTPDFTLTVPTDRYIRAVIPSQLAEKHLDIIGGSFDGHFEHLPIKLVNLGTEPFTLTADQVIGHLVIESCIRAPFNVVQELESTTRGEGGFGSTGVSEEVSDQPPTKKKATEAAVGGTDVLTWTKKTETARDLVYGSELAAGADVCADEEAKIPAKGLAWVKTGLSLAVNSGYYVRIAPRSGLSVKQGIHIGGGVVLPDQADDLKVLIFNFGDAEFAVAPGDRIAQLIVEAAGPIELIDGEDTSSKDASEGEVDVEGETVA